MKIILSDHMQTHSTKLVRMTRSRYLNKENKSQVLVEIIQLKREMRLVEQIQKDIL